MIHRFIAAVALASLVVACGGSTVVSPLPGGATTAPGAATPGAATPGVATPGGGNSGDFEGIARALVPPGATEVSTGTFGNAFQLVVSSTMSAQDLAAFYTQQIPRLGLSEAGRFETDGTMTIAFNNPDGGILMVPDEETGQNLVTISVGF